MSNSTSVFNSLQEAMRTLERRTEKRASDGLNSSMPDDPSGTGFQDPTTGAAYAEYEKEYDKADPFQNITPPSMETDNQQEHSNSDFDIMLSDEGISGQDYCKETKDDPQGTAMPAEAGEEKYAAYMRFSFEENVAGFNKAAGYFLHNYTKQAGYTKSASADTGSYAQPDAQKFYAGLLNNMVSLSDEDLVKTAMDADKTINALYAGLEQEKQAMSMLNVSDYALLRELPVEQLNEVTVKAAEAFNKYAEEVDVEAAPEDEELAALEELTPEEIELLSQLSEEDLEQLITEAENAETGAALEGNPDVAEEAQAIAELPEEQVDALATMPEEKLAGYIQKLAEDIAIEDATGVPAEELAAGALQEEPAVDEEALAEALSDVPPEALEALDQMSPEELASLIDQIDSTASNDNALAAAAAMAGANGEAPAQELCGPEGCGDDAAALNELSSAMTEQGVTPEDLATLGKEGSAKRLAWYKIAAAVKNLRDSGRYLYTPPRTSKAAALRKQMNEFLAEITRP